jgi:hypothetical protein
MKKGIALPEDGRRIRKLHNISFPNELIEADPILKTIPKREYFSLFIDHVEDMAPKTFYSFLYPINFEIVPLDPFIYYMYACLVTIERLQSAEKDKLRKTFQIDQDFATFLKQIQSKLPSTILSDEFLVS